MKSAAVRSIRERQKKSTENLIYNNGVKFITDDAFLGLTMQMGYPGYVDGHEKFGTTIPVRRMLIKCFRSGKLMSNSCTQQRRCSTQTAEVLSALQTAYPRFDHRFCFDITVCPRST